MQQLSDKLLSVEELPFFMKGWIWVIFHVPVQEIVLKAEK